MLENESEYWRFRDREDAAERLAFRLKTHRFRNPLVLAIPRGGVVTGAVLARELNAELDVVISRKLRAPGNPELAIGAINEDGEMIVSDIASEFPHVVTKQYLDCEREYQLGEIARRKRVFRSIRTAAPITGRSVIVTDDGIATGNTMISALHTVKAKKPYELIVACPVGAPSRLIEIRKCCDEIVCLVTSESLRAVGEFYDDFTPVTDDEAAKLLSMAKVEPHQVRPRRE